MPGALKWTLLTLLTLYLCLAIAHLMIAPTGQTGYQNAPDEAAHVAYVRSLAAGHLPSQQAPLAPNLTVMPSYEWHQPPLYYLLAAPLLQFGERALRAASILCGLAALCLIYRILRVAYPERPLFAVLSVGIAALTPTHIAITSTVNNDALLESCFSGTLLALLASFHGGFTTRRAIWLGIGISSAILTKATGLLLLPICFFGLYLILRAGESSRTLLRGAMLTLVTILVLTGWWFVRNLILYKELLPLHGFADAFAGTMQAEKMQQRLGGWGAYFLLMGRGIFQSFWAVYGRPEDAALGIPRFLPDSVYLLFAIICTTSLVGLIRIHFRRKVEFTQNQIYVVWILFATVGLVSISFATFILKYFQMQGRYLYPAMMPICSLLALGWLSIFPSRYQKIATALLLGLLAALCVIFLRAL